MSGAPSSYASVKPTLPTDSCKGNGHHRPQPARPEGVPGALTGRAKHIIMASLARDCPDVDSLGPETRTLHGPERPTNEMGASWPREKEWQKARAVVRRR